MESRESPRTTSQDRPERVVSWKALWRGGIQRIAAMSRAETPKETISQGLMPSARTQMGSVLERWLKARSIWDSASTQKAMVCPVVWSAIRTPIQ